MSDLYKKLYVYREKLRDRENKHTPSAVIGDAPLKALARLAPTSIEDMLKVTGVGKAFVTKYGTGFLNVILSEQKPMKLKIMQSDVRQTLKSLQSRLTNVNRRNRLLYLPKMQSGRAVDLCRGGELDEAFISSLMAFNGKPVTLCNADSPLYDQMNKLIRVSTAAVRESGTNALYVGYPFVLGSCGEAGNAFNVAAPLVLFPVKAENDGGKIKLSTDDSRDITFNKAFILCYNKFNNRSSNVLPQCNIDSVYRWNFIKEIISFYKGAGIELKNGESDKLVHYGHYTDKTFPKFGVNEFTLSHNAVVGLFPMYSGEIQKDFDDIIETGLMPPTLTGLLEGADEVEDFYGDSIELVEATPVESEGNIDYISELNVSQEKAVEKSEQELAMVMQGPPGTGKSQTITSMISDAVNKGKNVLVVSQKRAALSVIYSRLGRLGRYALFVDDPKDKQGFYLRLKAMFDSAEASAPFNSVALKRAVDGADADLKALTALSDALSNEAFGAPMINIYQENLRNKFKAAERDGAVDSSARAAAFSDNIPQALFDCGYEEIKQAFEYLSDDELISELEAYYDLADKYEWIVNVRGNLSSAEQNGLVSELDGLLDLYAYGKFKFKYKKALKAFLKNNFVARVKEAYKLFKKDPVSLYNGVKEYGKFHSVKITADGLNKCASLYFGAAVNVARELGEPVRGILPELMEYCGYAFIDKFENENREQISRMSGYDGIVKRICANMLRKQRLTRDKTLNLLKTIFAENIAESKRRGEMLRAIEGKRRPATSKFAEKFAFELFRGVRIFLMTPEAVSEILPLENGLFDFLVFDEASQIYVERGIPAIARAKRMVVAGDHKQLRPSSLGDGRVTVDEDEENEAVLEEESLLDIARFKFPEVMLSYHYRSRYEELIAFSNAAFYDGKLNISPNPKKPEFSPITVHKVNGKWDDRVNKVEAEKVLELITEHLKSVADKPQAERETLGVISFNAKQRDCILDLIDKKCDEDGEFKTLYTQELLRREDGEDLGLFVKNIENVQGDERDRIIFSFAYAYNSKGVMSRNFGWLNREGGENRLNVAISRAKKRVDIVTSIIPSDLKVDDINTRGVHLLRSYLDYAYCISDGDREGAQTVLDSLMPSKIVTISPQASTKGVRDEIRKELEKRGYSVESDVGMGNYKIDLALKNDAGDYTLGIECDDQLDKKCSVRERDVMRRKFLESRGWRLHRVWTSEFYDDPNRVLEQIISSCREN